MTYGNYWASYWATQINGAHRSQEESFLEKEGREKLFHLGVPPGRDSLLDFGCGSGDLLVYYAPHFKRVIGSDFSESMLKNAANRIAERGLENISLLHADDNTIWEKNFGPFDIITTAGVIQYFSLGQVENLIKNGKRFLKPEGKIIFFDIIDPRIFFLFELGIFKSKRIGAFRILKSFIALTMHRLKRKFRGLPISEMGYAHLPQAIIDIASKYQFTSRYCCSMYYEYRYHLILTPNV